MFEYLEPDNRIASNFPPSPSAKPQPRPDRLRHLIYESLPAIDRTIKTLHAYGYADPNDWSDPIPVPPSPVSQAAGTTSPDAIVWMAILTKTLLIE